jgi:hypothetical protein
MPCMHAAACYVGQEGVFRCVGACGLLCKHKLGHETVWQLVQSIHHPYSLMSQFVQCVLGFCVVHTGQCQHCSAGSARQVPLGVDLCSIKSHADHEVGWHAGLFCCTGDKHT